MVGFQVRNDYISKILFLGGSWGGEAPEVSPLGGAEEVESPEIRLLGGAEEVELPR